MKRQTACPSCAVLSPSLRACSTPCVPRLMISITASRPDGAGSGSVLGHRASLAGARSARPEEPPALNATCAFAVEEGARNSSTRILRARCASERTRSPHRPRALRAGAPFPGAPRDEPLSLFDDAPPRSREIDDPRGRFAHRGRAGVADFADQSHMTRHFGLPPSGCRAAAGRRSMYGLHRRWPILLQDTARADRRHLLARHDRRRAEISESFVRASGPGGQHVNTLLDRGASCASTQGARPRCRP